MIANFFCPIGGVAGDGVQVGRLAVTPAIDRAVERIGAAKDAGHRVIVPGWDGVKLVVVTAGARDGQAKECPCRCIDLLVDHVEFEKYLVALIERFGAKREETSRNEFFVGGFSFVATKQITGNLFPYEPSKRLVVVERVDHVVAVAPRMGVGEDAFHAVGLAIACDVEPVPSPVFAEVGRPQQLIDNFLKGVR